jgi:hypothetical protein
MPQSPQNYSNHVRLDPPFHFVAMPLLMLATVTSLINAILLGGRYTHWVVVVLAAGALVAGALIRLRGLRLQDRIIRLEVGLRYDRLASEKGSEEILPQLTTPQVVALRFASDAELVELTNRALREKMSSRDIKRAIRDWRADHFRI